MKKLIILFCAPFLFFSCTQSLPELEEVTLSESVSDLESTLDLSQPLVLTTYTLEQDQWSVADRYSIEEPISLFSTTAEGVTIPAMEKIEEAVESWKGLASNEMLTFSTQGTKIESSIPPLPEDLPISFEGIFQNQYGTWYVAKCIVVHIQTLTVYYLCNN